MNKQKQQQNMENISKSTRRLQVGGQNWGCKRNSRHKEMCWGAKLSDYEKRKYDGWVRLVSRVVAGK